MSDKRTVIISIIFVLVFGAYYLYTSVLKPKQEEKKAEESAVFSIKEDDLEKIDLLVRLDDDPEEEEIVFDEEPERETQREFTFEKEKKSPEEIEQQKKESEDEFDPMFEAERDYVWYITRPKRAKAEQSTIRYIGRSLTNASIMETVEENPGDLEQYGLEPPKYEAVLYQGDKAETLYIGKNTIDNRGLYAKRKDGNSVIIIDSGVKFHLDKRLTEYRDKAIFTADIEQVEKAAVHHQGSFYLFEKKDDKWTVANPVIPREDPRQISNYINGLLKMQTAEFFEMTTKRRIESWVDNSNDYVEIYIKDQKDPIVLRTGNLTPDRQYLYAYLEGSDELLGLPPTIDNTLEPSKDRLITKSLFDFERENITELVFQDGDSSYVIKKSDSNDSKENLWTLASPAEKTLDSSQIEDVLRNVRNFFISDAFFMQNKLQEFGLDKPQFTLTGRNKEGEQVFAFAAGAPAPDPEKIYVRADSEDIACIMPKNTISKLREDLENIVNPKEKEETSPEESGEKNE